MNKKIYLAAGSLVVASLLFVTFINLFPKSQNTTKPGSFNVSDLINRTSTEKEVSSLPAGAFGNLSALATLSGTNDKAGDLAATVAPVGMGGGGQVTMATESATNDTAVLVDGLGGMDRMILPFYGFKYVYEGEELNLEEDSADVYRRLKGQDSLAKSLAKSLVSAGFSEISLNSFQNLKMTSFSLTEDTDLGLFITFDLNEDNIYIYENWEKWRDPAREQCMDQACWDRYRLQLSDIPADSELISIADNFLSKHKVSLTNYGTPRVENLWREQYEATTDKANFYIPEYATVIYPLLIDGQEVRDQSGSYAGLRININVVKKAAAGLNGLVPYRYEASAYTLETDSAEIIKSAENGGFSRNYYIQEQEANLQTVTLGTPTKAYVQIYRYENNRNDELLVPALIFPVTSRPQTDFYYYGQSYVIVPLVKDILAELNKEPDWLPRDIMPMPAIDFESGDMEGEASSGVDTETILPGEVRIMPVTETETVE